MIYIIDIYHANPDTVSIWLTTTSMCLSPNVCHTIYYLTTNFYVSAIITVIISILLPCFHTTHKLDVFPKSTNLPLIHSTMFCAEAYN